MKYLFVLIGAVLLMSVALWWHARATDQGEGPPPESRAPVSPQSAGLGNMATGLKPLPALAASGVTTVVADPILVTPCTLIPIQEQEIASQLDGVIQAMRVELGQKVSAGECLAQLDDGKLRPQFQLL
jgi:multidrug efflux pump subunit AcrA (membrane-fusion protein)